MAYFTFCKSSSHTTSANSYSIKVSELFLDLNQSVLSINRFCRSVVTEILIHVNKLCARFSGLNRTEEEPQLGRYFRRIFHNFNPVTVEILANINEVRTF